MVVTYTSPFRMVICNVLFDSTFTIYSHFISILPGPSTSKRSLANFMLLISPVRVFPFLKVTLSVFCATPISDNINRMINPNIFKKTWKTIIVMNCLEIMMLKYASLDALYCGVIVLIHLSEQVFLNNYLLHD